jgi:hypothetical protein
MSPTSNIAGMSGAMVTADTSGLVTDKRTTA